MSEEIFKKIYLFTGENDYLLKKELRRWKDSFAEKNWVESVISFGRENWDYGRIKQTIFWWWFFVTNKLVILYGLPLDTEKSNTMKVDEVEKLADDIMNMQIPKEVLLVCVSYKPDKRGRFYKRIDKLNKENLNQKIIKSFSLPSENELFDFVMQESKNLNLNSESIKALIHKVWNNQFRLVSELEKLALRKEYYREEITPEIIWEVSFWLVEQDVFRLLDLILTNSKSAINFIQELVNDWLDWNALNWSLMWWIRNYLFVLDYEERWITSFKDIAVELKQSPRAILNVVKKISFLKEKKKMIENLFKNIVDIDYQIKNGETQIESYFIMVKKILLS